MRGVAVIALSSLLAGCSVLMAMEGDEDRDYSSFRPGTHREDVHQRFGPPVTSITEDGQTVDTYKIEEGDESNPGRGVVHLLADLATLGIWEVIATPFEWFQGKDVTYVLRYGADDTVESVTPTPPGLEFSQGFRIIEPAPAVAVASPESAEDRSDRSDVDTVPVLNPRPRTQGHAVVVGVESYRERLAPADYAAHDARIVSKYLTEVLGYPEENVALLVNENATQADFHKYFESWLPNRVETTDSVFVYFSGHGAPSVKTGEAYLVPYDGDPQYLDKTGYPLSMLYEYLNRLPAKEVLVVLDSCFSGAGGRSVIAKGMRPIVLSVENPLLAQGKTVVLGASAGEQVANTYQEQRHGLLTYFFLKGLRGAGDQNRDGAIELVELYSYLRPNVMRTARREFNNDQVPQLFGSPDALERGIHLLKRGRGLVARSFPE